MALGVLAFAGNLFAGSETGDTHKSYGYFDFATCVRYALVHSQHLLKSRLDIQIKSVDLKDAHSELLPTVVLITRFYIIRANNNGSAFNYEIQVQQWDPYVAMVKVKSQEIMIDIAKTNHMDKISDSMAEMARLFYRVHLIDRALQARGQVVAIHREKVNYLGNKVRQGTGDEVESRIAETVMKAEELKLRDLEKEKAERIADLKRIMGYEPDFELPLDTRDAVNQILGGFNGQFVTYSDIQEANRYLRILAKQEQLQSNTVLGTYLALVPKPLMVLEGLMGQPDRTSGLNVALGVAYPVWDGFERVRDIKRQKMKAEQARIDRDNRSRELYNKYNSLLGALRMCAAKDAFFREKIRVSELNEERAFLLFKQGRTPNEPLTRTPGRPPGESQTRDSALPRDLYGNYLDRRVEKVEAQLEALSNTQDRVAALIDLASIAGGLERYNARIRY